MSHMSQRESCAECVCLARGALQDIPCSTWLSPAHLVQAIGHYGATATCSVKVKKICFHVLTSWPAGQKGKKNVDCVCRKIREHPIFELSRREVLTSQISQQNTHTHTKSLVFVLILLLPFCFSQKKGGVKKKCKQLTAKPMKAPLGFKKKGGGVEKKCQGIRRK